MLYRGQIVHRCQFRTLVETHARWSQALWEKQGHPVPVRTAIWRIVNIYKKTGFIFKNMVYTAPSMKRES
jgi:hypothetical protein